MDPLDLDQDVDAGQGDWRDEPLPAWAMLAEQVHEAAQRAARAAARRAARAEARRASGAARLIRGRAPARRAPRRTRVTRLTSRRASTDGDDGDGGDGPAPSPVACEARRRGGAS